MSKSFLQMSVLVAGSVLTVCSLNAHAQNFTVQIDSKVSSTVFNAGIELNTTGILIGDYDPDTNPGGTQTRAGFFGGSGNQPIDTSASILSDSSLNTHPAGGWIFSPDFDLLTAEIDGLSVDLLNGNTGSSALSMTTLYDTFHTVNPSFLYPGGVPITLPFGEVGGINEAVITQSSVGSGTMTPTEDGHVFDFTLLVPANLDLLITQSFPGSDPTNTPISLPIVLPIVGQLTVLDDGSVLLNASINPDPISSEIPLPNASLPDIPLGLPTFGSQTASVVFTLTPETIAINAGIEISLVASGSVPACSADINGDGVLNFFDVSDFLNAFSAMDPIADFSSDGQFNFFDVSAFLNAFSAGCP